jgi:hypothetical protein
VRRWIVALARHCERQSVLIDKLKAPQIQKKFCIDTDSVFLKPIEAKDTTFAYFVTTNLLSVFQKLSNHPPAWNNVFAPVGWIGLPADRHKGTLEDWIRKFLKEKFRRNEQIEEAGWPVLVYPRWDGDWQCCSESDVMLRLKDRKELFLSEIKRIFKDTEEAGLIHLDGLLQNFICKFTNDESGNRSRSSSSSSSSSGSISNNTKFTVKLIDWDTCYPIGYTIRPTLVAAFTNDSSNRYPKNETVATSVYHNFFYEFIKETLEDKVEDKVDHNVSNSSSSST